MRFRLLLLLILSSSAGWSQDVYFPPAGNEWAVLDPQTELNWCPEKLDSLHTLLHEANTKAFILLKGGRIALEWYFDSFTADSLWYWASAGKTMTAALIGIAQQEGLLDIHEPTSQYLGEGWTSLTPQQEQAITIWHQLTMTTGLDYEAASLDCTDPACLQYKAEPGTQWFYHNAPYTLLTHVLSSASGLNHNLYYTSRLGSKIGAGGFYLGLPQGFNRVFFSRARDMARFGLLIQRNGMWHDEAVISDTMFVRDMINTSQTLNPSYGYLWWLNGKNSHILPGVPFSFNGALLPVAPPDLYAGLGANDQKLYIVPSLDWVVVRLGNSAGPVLPSLSSFDTPLWERLMDLSCSTSTLLPGSESGWRVYPTVTSDAWTIDGATVAAWQLFDARGCLLRSGGTQHLIEADVPTGLYVLRLLHDSGYVQTFQVIRG
jgi:CubicO group peptidase (beta-lactamase class C family)